MTANPAAILRDELISLSMNVRKGGGELTLDQLADRLVELANKIVVEPPAAGSDAESERGN